MVTRNVAAAWAASVLCATALTGCSCDGDDNGADAPVMVTDDGRDAGTPQAPDADDDVDAPPFIPASGNPCRFPSDCSPGELCSYDRDQNRKVCTNCRLDRDCCEDGTAACGRVCAGGLCLRGGPETCNGADDNRDGMTDEDFDLDADPFNCGSCGVSCDAAIPHARPNGTTCTAGVCLLLVDGCAEGFSDLNGTASDGCEYACFPTRSGVEAPDGVDNNCNGATDEGFACENGAVQPCGSGTGICEEGRQLCLGGAWTVCDGALTARGAEACNGLDDDCDGVADEDYDLANDPANCGACGRSCAAIYANADVRCDTGQCLFTACHDDARDRDGNRDNGCEACPVVPILNDEVCGNGQDDDCDGAADDGCACDPGDERRCGLAPGLDGVGTCRTGIQACTADANGANAVWGGCLGAVEPSPETCNRADDDCDGAVPADETDGDRDGFTPCEGDCNDADPFVQPNMPELCNGLDDDCNGRTDEEPFFIGAPCDGAGVCGVGRLECASLISVRCSTGAGGSFDESAPETCNRADDDCDGVADDVAAAALAADAANCGACGVSCTVPNTVTACVGGSCATTGCAAGFALQGDGSCLRCDVWPARAETCDAAFLDEDCDGLRNETCGCIEGAVQPCGLDPMRNGVGVCHVGTQTCVAGVWGGCLGAVAPSPETCNRADDDCSGAAPANETDGDRDGFTPCEGDCNDLDPAVKPGVRETCDGLDNDCDGSVDEDYAVGVACRGIGTCGIGVYECSGLAAVRCSTDVGGSADRSASETCNRADDDCDGVADDVAAAALAADAANCGACGIVCRFPNAAASCAAGACALGACAPGFVNADGDAATGCEYRCTRTADPADGPNAQCDGLDNDCDGTADEGCSCRDGSTRPCGPSAPSCDLATGTCRGECTIGVQACAGGAWGGCLGAVFPVAERCNGFDDDCSGTTPPNETDGDRDGFTPCEGDCNDAVAAVRPGADETCNGTDDDCDGAVDEGYFVGAPCNRGGAFGPACGGGRLECDPADPFLPARCSTSPGGSAYPAPPPIETCDNGLDDDCDSTVDDGCTGCVPGTRRDCGTDPELNGVGICRVGLQTCQVDRAWGTCTGAQPPKPETCDGADQDCDGVVNNGFDFAMDVFNCGACGNDCTTRANVAFSACGGGTCVPVLCRGGWYDLDLDEGNGCEYGCFPTRGGSEFCDGIDNDCDGVVDEDPTCAPPAPGTGAEVVRITLPAGFPLDATRQFCSTFMSGRWSCTAYAVTLEADGRTLAVSGTAVSGFHVFNVCSSNCDVPALATWVVVRDAAGNPDAQGAVLATLTYGGAATVQTLVPNGAGGGNWYTVNP